MNRPVQGRYLRVTAGGEAADAFVPTPLPPAPPLVWTHTLHAGCNAALVALGRLDAVTDLLPNASLLLYSFVRKEAVLSSMIEGTQSSLADLMLFELDEQPGVPVEDAREVSRYVAALEHGLTRLRGGFPLSLRLLREVHKVLLGGGRGGQLTPGEFRRSQVWIGGTRPGNAVFVPPPANEIDECLKHLERFLHDEPEATPPLVKAALAHVQFETIHPFLDGNGRVGRLLIALQFSADGLLREPLLYLSLHFKEHRQTYYELLNGVRLSGDWEMPPKRRAPPGACWTSRPPMPSGSRTWDVPPHPRWRSTEPSSDSPSPRRPRWEKPRN
jgi:Fic family protein